MFFIESNSYKCPNDCCDKQYNTLAELKNHILDHDTIYKREFHMFQRVRIINDDGIYMILYIDRVSDTFLLRLCGDSKGNYDYKYVPAVKVMNIETPKKNDIVSMETGQLTPADKGYLQHLKMAIIREEKIHIDGHSSWVLQFIMNNEYAFWFNFFYTFNGLIFNNIKITFLLLESKKCMMKML